MPRSTTPLGWSHAFAILALQELSATPGKGPARVVSMDMGRPVQLAIAVAAALLLASCGGSGEPGPKRAVDARTETIHFFPADEPFVAFLNTSTADRLELHRTIRGLGTIRAIRAFTGNAAGFVGRAGLDLRPLVELLTDDEPDDGIAASQAAFGLRPRGRPAEDVLVVLAGDRPDEIEAAVEEMAAGAGLDEETEFHDARIFGADGIALAVRDGVVLIGAGTAQLRAALRLRDSDQDEQLDEGQIADLLDELQQNRPWSPTPTSRLSRPIPESPRSSSAGERG